MLLSGSALYKKLVKLLGTAVQLNFSTCFGYIRAIIDDLGENCRTRKESESFQ